MGPFSPFRYPHPYSRMPGLDQIPAHESVNNNNTDFQNSPVLTAENLKFLESPSPLSAVEYPQTKDSPLTDIGTSPPPFEIPSLGDRRRHSRDTYESSELSDLGDDESEAETDKMDFLNEDSNSRIGDRDSDLQRLSDLTDLANLQELDSDDSEDDLPARNPSPSPDAVKPEAAQNVHTTKSSKRPLDTSSGAESDEHKEESSSDTDPDSNKRRKITGETTPEASVDDADPKIDVDVKSEINVVKEIIENGAEPLSWPSADSVITAITPIDSLAVTKEPSATDAMEEEQVSDAGLLRSEADVDDGATADVEDIVKLEQIEDQEREDQECEDENREDQELEEDPAAESEEESEIPGSAEDVDLDEQRKSAIEELISIENDFSFLRDKLYRDKLSLLEHEMQLCLDGSHPELLQIYYKVNGFYQDNIKLANATLNYSLKCINTETIATRTSIHQNFMKNLAGTRNEMITETTSSWYKINKEWNYLDLAVADYNFTAIPSASPHDLNIPLVAGGSTMEYYQDNGAMNKKIQKQNTIVELVHRRNCVNAQLGILNGLKEFHGIPSAVSNSLLADEELPVDELLLRKATPEEINEDLQAMGIY